MDIQIKKPFLNRALSPIAFTTNELVTVPDDVARKLIKQGYAVDAKKIQTPSIETR